MASDMDIMERLKRCGFTNVIQRIQHISKLQLREWIGERIAGLVGAD